jgi:hypothetical protein
MIKFAKADPAKFTLKAAQLGMISSGMYYAAHLNFPEVMDQVSEQQQKDNFIIPMGGLYTVDKNGEKRYAYVSIPKDQSQRAITSVFEYLASKSIGKPRDLSYVGKGVLDFLPITPTQLSSPVQNALRTYVENKDTFTGENVWKGKNVLPKDEYTRTTAPQFVQFGQATGMSPERTKAALQKVFTYGNLFTDIAGYGFKKVLSESGTAGDEIMKDIQTKIPLFSGLVKFTNPKSELEPMIKDMEANENSRRLNMGRQIDKFIEKGQGGYAPGFQPWLQEQRPEDMKWAINDYRTKMITKDVPNKNFWISLKNMPDETRANVFYHEYQKADDQKKAELMRNVALFKLRTIPFTMYFNKLLSGGTQ